MLFEKQILEYKGFVFNIPDINKFSLDFPLHGTKGSKGTCKHADSPFEAGGKIFKNNWVTMQISGRVKTTKYSYDTEQKLLKIDGENIPISKGYKNSILKSYVWNATTPSCDQSLKKVYEGTATIITPMNENFRTQLLVSDKGRDVVFGLGK